MLYYFLLSSILPNEFYDHHEHLGIIKNQDIAFNQLQRAETVSNLSNNHYDLIIIGGGITGAGIALDASLRKLKVLLVEKKDFAAGTSSKSTKLIHGGLRYLKKFEIGLVRESGLERAIAHSNIPHLVHPEKMLLPIVNNGTFGRLSANLAISIYDRLAKVPSKDRKKSLSKEDFLKREPLINPDILKSGIMYSEYRTDDARLSIELVKAARRESAEAINYMEVQEFYYEDGKVQGVHCMDHLQGESIIFKASQVVSAGGPWVDLLREKNHSKKGKSLRLTKGVHIVVNHKRLPLKHSIYFDDFNGRMIFAIPRGKVTYIGTSDTEYKKSLDRVICDTEDMDYLLRTVNNMFKAIDLNSSDVVSSWAGLRPLIHKKGKSPSDLSRKDEIFESESGLISIAGGKLTGYRKMAERVVNLVLDRNPSFGNEEAITEQYKIHVDSFLNYEEYSNFLNEITTKNLPKGISKYYSWYLCSTFGKHAEMIISQALKDDERELSAALIKAEIDYCVTFESAVKPEDYFNRRSGKLYFDIDSVKTNFDLIHTCFQNHFGWTAPQLEKIKAASEVYIADAILIKSKHNDG